MTENKKNARRQPGAVVQFLPARTGGGNYTARCASCGAPSRGFPLCVPCGRWKLAARHTRAAASLIRNAR